MDDGGRGGKENFFSKTYFDEFATWEKLFMAQAKALLQYL